jgi:hypothetical protein
MKFGVLVALCASAAFLGSGGYTILPPSVQSPIASLSQATPTIIKSGVVVQRGSVCNIKGNVSIGSGERIYHVPGQHYYNATKISPKYGERWFCSEEEARAAGWRRASY